MSEKFITITSGDTTYTAQASEDTPIEAGSHTHVSAEEALGGGSVKFTLGMQTELPDGSADIR